MPKSRIILCLGFFIALLPELGFPHSWNSFFEVASGLLIVLLSVLISVDRRLMLKAKAEKRTQRKRAIVTTPETPLEERVEEKVEEITETPLVLEPEPLSVTGSTSISEPVFETPVIQSADVLQTPVVAPAEAPAPRRKRKVRVVDGDATATTGFEPESRSDI